MSSPLTHERCSELLAAYLSRELDPEQHRLVEDHLEHCAQCSAERAGLAALRSDARGEGLTGDERARLRAVVLAEIRDPSGSPPLRDESDAVVVPLGARESRAGKYLGIAAMLAILAVGSLFVLRGGGLGVMGSADSDAGSSAVGNAEGSGGESRDEDTASEEAAPEANRGALAIRPRFQSDIGEISEADLDGLGQQPISSFRSNATNTYDTKSENEDLGQTLADRGPEKSLDRLAARAPEALAPAVAECGQTALADLGEPGLATFATTATIEGDDAIIISFVTGGRTPDRYAVFAFPRGDCTTILTSTEGPLE